MSGADVSVRLAWPDDATAIARVQRAVWTEQLGDDARSLLEGSTVDPVEPWTLMITSPPDARARVLVALERAEVRGVAFVHPCADPDADPVADGEVGELLVHPDHRGTGHGTRLLQAAMDTLRADRFTRAHWWLRSDDDATRAFVTATGWAPDGAHRELAADDDTRLKQVRLATRLVED